MTNLHSYITNSSLWVRCRQQAQTESASFIVLLKKLHTTSLPSPCLWNMMKLFWCHHSIAVFMQAGTSMRTMGTGSGFIYSRWKAWQRPLIRGLRGMFKVAPWQNPLYRAEGGGWQVSVLLTQDICRNEAIGECLTIPSLPAQQGREGSGEKRKSGCQKRTK